MTEQVLQHVDTQPATLLIVEDDPDIQATIRDLLALASYEVVAADTGAAALDVLDHVPIDLVILDVMLPDMSGYEICDQIRQSTLARVPIIMLTALSQPQDVKMGLEVGTDDYLAKPFMPDELLLRIRGLLRRHETTRSAEQETEALRSTLQLVQRQLTASQNETQIEATLRREFLHNVSTHMQALYGIVEAALRKLPPGHERDAVQQIKSRVGGAALVYQVSEALQSDPVEIGHVVRTIATALKNMYRPWKRVMLTVKGEPMELPLAVASPLAMIVNELVTNCFKHAFPENRFGNIDINFGLNNGTFALDTIDNGVGFATDRPIGRMGCAAVGQLVEGLGGTVNWQSGVTGTHVAIRIPMPDPAADPLAMTGITAPADTASTATV